MSKIRLFFLAALFCGMLPLPVSADLSPVLAFHKNPEEIKTIDDLIKDLLDNPADKRTKSALKSAVAAQSSLSDAYAMQLARFIELVDYSEFIRNRIQYLEDINQRLSLKILANVQENDKASVAKMFEPAAKEGTAIYISTLKLSHMPVVDLNQVNADLVEQRKKLLSRLEDVQAQNARLRSLARKFIPRTDSAEVISPISNQSRQKEVQDLAEDLQTVKAGFSGLQQEVLSAQEQIDQLNQRIAGMSLEIYEKDTELKDKQAVIADLKNQLDDSSQRLLLVQKIIQEKDQLIDQLDQQIVELREGLARSGSKKLSRKEAKEEREIERELQSVTQKYETLKTSFLKKENQVNEFAGVVEIYKWKLHDIHRALKEQAKDLEKLRQQMKNVTAPSPALPSESTPVSEEERSRQMFESTAIEGIPLTISRNN